MDFAEHIQENASAGIDGGVHILCEVVAVPNGTDIVRRAGTEPTVHILVRGAGFAHNREFLHRVAAAVAGNRHGLQQLAHDICGVLGDRLLPFRIAVGQQDFAGAVFDFVIAVRLIIQTAIAERCVCSGHLQRCGAVRHGADTDGRQRGVVGHIHVGEMEVIGHVVQTR